VATVTLVTLFRDMADHLIVLPPERLTHLMLHAMFDLALAFLGKGDICFLQVKNILEVFCDRLKHLIAKTLSTFNILRVILRVEGHVKPLKL
jgi:hypothetical protein